MSYVALYEKQDDYECWVMMLRIWKEIIVTYMTVICMKALRKSTETHCQVSQ